jgi:hypothetical protein
MPSIGVKAIDPTESAMPRTLTPVLTVDQHRTGSIPAYRRRRQPPAAARIGQTAETPDRPLRLTNWRRSKPPAARIWNPSHVTPKERR